MQASALNERALKIKNDSNEINSFVEEYKPFIASCVHKSTGRYENFGQSDELSVGMTAFLEAINSYDISKGHFLSFARTVICRRLIDHFRKENKHSKVISIGEYLINNENGETTDLTEDKAIQLFTEEEINQYRRLEINEFKNELKEWGISLLELTYVSPKQEKTRRQYMDIVRSITGNENLLKQLKQKRYLPINEIEKITKIPRKTIERARKYIVAVVIIMTGDYQYINNFMEKG